MRRIFPVAQLVDDFEQRAAHHYAALLESRVARPVLLRQPESRQCYFLVEIGKRALLEVFIRNLRAFIRIACKQSLVETLGRRERRSAAEEYIEKSQLRNVAADDGQTYG